MRYSLVPWALCIMITSGALPLVAQGGIDDYDADGKTKLINAIAEKDYDEAKRLISDGAEVNRSEQKGLKGTPLMYATYTGNVDLCALLLKKGAEVNALDHNNDPALNWATYYGQIDVMQFLLNNGADMSLKSKHGNAIDVALRLWHADSVVQVFRDRITTKTLSRRERKILQCAINGDSEKMRKSWKKNISPDLKDQVGIPLLQHTAQANDLRSTQFLLNQGANVNILNRVGQTPLTWAARYGHIEMIKLLLQAGADPNQTDSKYQLSALIGAAVDGDTTTAKLLVQNGADINHKEVVNNASALHWAIFRANDDFVKYLVNQGANYHEKGLENNQTSAYDLAVAYDNKELLSFFDTKDHEKKKEELLGAWRIKEIHYLYPDTTYIKDELDYGRLIVSPSHYAIQYQPMMMQRTPFKNLSKGEDEEIKRAFQSIVFNSGTYLLEEDVLHTTADIAKVPGFEGGQQYYQMQLEGDQCNMTLFDETYPNGEKPEWHGKVKVKFIMTKE